MTTRFLCLLLALASLAGCDDDAKKKRLESMGTSPSASAPAPWETPAARAQASAAMTATAAPSASAAPVKLTGNKSLVERLRGGKWFKQISDAEKATNQAELDKAEQALKDAKTDADKRAAKARKITVEEVAFTWTEFSDKERITKAPPARLVVKRNYEVIKSDGNVLTLRIWDAMMPQGGLEVYTFLDDNTVRLVQGNSDKFEILARK